MDRTILWPGCLDTKGIKSGYAMEKIKRKGHPVVVIDERV
jgi:hypothetical protein